jgi:hypothetical protein
MNIFQFYKAILLSFVPSAIAFAGNTLPPDTYLTNGQYIVSSSWNYWLSMQTDGSLVMYRGDGTVRYSMKKYGRVAYMQADGNFVEYNRKWKPLWHTNTAGNPGAYLAIQDDGNLVVYSHSGTPLWNIGAEPSREDPHNPAEVLGRDLAITGLGWVGHVALWDGSRVIQALNEQGNAINLTSLGAYKAASTYWGTARPRIPEGEMLPRCYLAHCSESQWDYETLSGRQAVAKAAYQAYLIGADYTLYTNVKFVEAGSPHRPAIRGLYRCDTFVWASMVMSTKYKYQLDPMQSSWVGNPPCK